MAWTAPRTWVAAETLTAALLNTHVRDNLLETAPAKVTTAGDITYATAANTITRLAIGTAGAVLVATSNAPRWSSTGVTAAAGSALNITLSTTLTAAANSDYMEQARVVGTFARSTFTGLTAVGLRIWGDAMSATGTGTIATAYGLYISVPTIGTTNWSMYVNDGNSRLGGTSSSVYIGDTSNANMTTGITTKGGDAGERFSIKCDVSHGGTSVTEADTAGVLAPFHATNGALYVAGFRSATAGAGLYLYGHHGTTDTTKSTAATAAIMALGATYSAGSRASIGANSNIVTFSDNGTVRFILDGDGDSHQDVGTAWTNFDDHDDAALLDLLSAHVTRADDPLRRNFAEWLEQDRAPLEAARIVTFNEDGHHFINWSRANMLVIGAIRQMAGRLRAATDKITALESKLSLLEG